MTFIIEIEDPGVLKEASCDGTDSDILTHSGNTGSETTDSSYDEVDLNACI